MPAHVIRGAAVLALGLLAGCAGRQSALAPAGEDARVLLTLFIVMLCGAVVLWLLLNGLVFYVTRINPERFSQRLGNMLVIGGGIVFPTVVIGALLVWGLSILPDRNVPGNGLQVRVTGEQWWWRVEYLPEEGGPVIAANELRLPAGERTEIRLNAKRVIHSFWVPALGGKLDMFPGRETRMTLKPETPGTYRGQCAEFCGASHAWMAFETVVMPPEEFDAWLATERKGARPPPSAEAERGQDIFFREGCGACHSIRGTEATGRVGPDLSHVGSRKSLGAGRLGTTLEDFGRWVAHTGELKPEVEMPSYDHLSQKDLAALATYLKGLE